MNPKKTVLCKLNEEYCPVVEFREDGKVTIGENEKVAELTKEQWNILVDLIEKKSLSKIEISQN